jgi:uncharacterized membrane protein
MENPTHASNPKDIYENKLIAAIGYLGILCLVPLLLKKDSPYAQFHGKQGLVILIAWLLLWVGNIVPLLGQIVWAVGSVILVILIIMGIIHALNGEYWEVPVLGKYAKQIKL